MMDPRGVRHDAKLRFRAAVLYSAGISAMAVAKQLGVSEDSVLRWVRASGAAVRPGTWTPVAVIVARAQSGVIDVPSVPEHTRREVSAMGLDTRYLRSVHHAAPKLAARYYAEAAARRKVEGIV